MEIARNITKSSARLPSLDGLRALSIGLVLFAHSHPTEELQKLAFYCGNLGVRIFFVISGFIITWLLLQEEKSSGGVSLRNFYIRRIARIFPAYYTYLVAVFLLDRAGLIDGGSTSQKLLNTLFLANYGPCEGPTGVLWSLGVEEQFYLFWPGIFMIFKLCKEKKVALTILLGVIFFSPALRGINTLFWKNQETYFWLNRFSFLFQMDIIAWGCAGAFVAFHWSQSVQYLAKYAVIVFFFAMFIITLPYTARGYDGYGIETVFGPTLEAFGASLIIFVSVAKSDLLLFRILNLRPVIWLGTLSYSLYLWHSVFAGNLLPQYGISQNLWIPVSIGVAMISYYLIELPFIQYRKHLRWNSSGRTS
jgi:peptidoglycan/LPS O-acetylase OafA/YrhL